MRNTTVEYRGYVLHPFRRAGSSLYWIYKNNRVVTTARSLREGKLAVDRYIGADRARVRKIRGNPSRIIPGNSAVHSEIAVVVYGRVLRIEAQKTQPHMCDPDCAAVGHRYYHDFKKGAVMYGLENGDLLIRKVR